MRASAPAGLGERSRPFSGEPLWELCRPIRVSTGRARSWRKRSSVAASIPRRSTRRFVAEGLASPGAGLGCESDRGGRCRIRTPADPRVIAFTREEDRSGSRTLFPPGPDDSVASSRVA